MSFDLEGRKCPVCQAYLFEEDDIVFCPECGAPHHRDCYKALGHCALQDDHGTDRQYDKVQAKKAESEEKIKVAYHSEKTDENRQESTVKCSMCGEEYEKSRRSCPKCNTPNISVMSGYENFDFLGGVPADMDLGSGVTADEAKRFVVANTNRYIPKFAAMAAGVKSSWNWIAFFFPGTWLLSRKMYKSGILVTALSIAFTMLTVPFSRAFYNIDTSSVRNYAEMAQMINDSMPNVGIAVIAAAFIGLVLNLVLSIVIAVKGDYFYKNHTISSILEIKKNSEDAETDYRKLGGVSLIAMIIGFMAVEYLPSIIAAFALV